MDAGCHVAQRLERERERERMVGPCREWLAAMTVETFCLEIPPKADENRVADSMSTRQARWGGLFVLQWKADTACMASSGEQVAYRVYHGPAGRWCSTEQR